MSQRGGWNASPRGGLHIRHQEEGGSRRGLRMSWWVSRHEIFLRSCFLFRVCYAKNTTIGRDTLFSGTLLALNASIPTLPAAPPILPLLSSAEVVCSLRCPWGWAARARLSIKIHSLYWSGGPSGEPWNILPPRKGRAWNHTQNPAPTPLYKGLPSLAEGGPFPGCSKAYTVPQSPKALETHAKCQGYWGH